MTPWEMLIVLAARIFDGLVRVTFERKLSVPLLPLAYSFRIVSAPRTLPLPMLSAPLVPSA
ncbi:MAG: hypothetical protein DMF18_03320, partial [Verrucomicrobia bacterium]